MSIQNTKERKNMWETLRKEEVERKLNTDFIKGLNTDEVLKRQNQYGKNELENSKKEGIIIKFLKQFNDFMIIILIMYMRKFQKRCKH